MQIVIDDYETHDLDFLVLVWEGMVPGIYADQFSRSGKMYVILSVHSNFHDVRSAAMSDMMPVLPHFVYVQRLGRLTPRSNVSNIVQSEPILTSTVFWPRLATPSYRAERVDPCSAKSRACISDPDRKRN